MEGREIKCPNCDSECREGAVFCDSCGERLPVSEPDPEPEASEAQSDSPDENDEAQRDETSTGGVAGSVEGEGRELDRDDTGNSLAGIEKELKALKRLFEEKITRSDYESAVLKRMSAEVEECRNDLYAKLTNPILKDIVDMHREMSNTLASYSSADEETVPLYVVDIFTKGLEDVLQNHGVEMVAPKVGDRFVSGEHRIIGKTNTTKREQHGTISEVSCCGFEKQGLCIAQAQVKVYAFTDSVDKNKQSPGNAAATFEESAIERDSFDQSTVE